MLALADLGIAPGAPSGVVADWLAFAQVRYLEQRCHLLLADVSSRAPAALDAALSLGRHFAHGLLGQVLHEVLQEQGTPELAKELFPKIPETTVALRELGHWAAERQLSALPVDAVAERAPLLLFVGYRLDALGRREEALAATEEAVQIRRRLAHARPDAFLPDLAMSLNNLGNRLDALGRREEALAATKEAVQIRRRLAHARPDAFLPDLAMSLNNLGNRLDALGRREEALAATKEAVQIRRRLAHARPDAFLPDLAMSLNNLGMMLNALGRAEEAQSPLLEAQRILNRLGGARS